MGTSDNFYLSRRSVLAKKMKNHPIKDEHIDLIVKAGIRVPDHGALNPWKIKIIKGEKLKITDEGIKTRDQIVINNFHQKRIPLCGVLGGGYNKDFNKLIELHSILHKSCAEII